MDKSNLICIHKARIAHHVAPVSKIDGQDRSAPILNRAGTVIVQFLIIVSSNVAARKHCLNMFQERRINRHNVLKASVDWAILHHPDLAGALNDLGLNLANLFAEQN